MNPLPQRIICLSAEAADWLWRIGAWERVVGVTAYFKAPAGAPSRPRVSGFSFANLEQIEGLKPDLVITFSDVQAAMTTVLREKGLNVLATDQRTLAEVEDALRLIAQAVGCEEEADKLLGIFRAYLAPVVFSTRPRVYFEEWDDPLVTGIGWVGELIERAGGKDVFATLREGRTAKERVVSPEQVGAARPEIIFASWCGKPLRSAEIVARPGWGKLPAVRAGRIYEIPGEDILQPGYRLIHGFQQMKRHLEALS